MALIAGSPFCYSAGVSIRNAHESLPMSSKRIYLATALMASLWLAGCASSSQPGYDYAPPPGAAPTEIKVIDTSDLQGTAGYKGEKVGAEVVSTEVDGDQQSYEIIVPMDPDQVDDVEVVTPGGDPVPLSREAQIIHNYETNNVGIRFEAPKNQKFDFRLKLIDHEDSDWPPFRQQ